MNQVIKHLNVAIDFDEDANEVTISAKRVAAKIGKTAFLAPSIFTVPSNFVLPP
jgi:hypothetical protein